MLAYAKYDQQICPIGIKLQLLGARLHEGLLMNPKFQYCPLKSVLNAVGYLGLQIDVKTVKKGQYIFFIILWTAFTLIPVELNP